jgi:hypothetical protein
MYRCRDWNSLHEASVVQRAISKPRIKYAQAIVMPFV